MKHTREELRQWQALPLGVKILMTKQRIRAWVHEYGEDGVYVSFSGGKDSTVLSHIVDDTFPGNNIPRVFVDTGLEYPEIRDFVKQEPRAVFLRPKMNFKRVIEKYGYPFISKEISQRVYEAQKGQNAAIEKIIGIRKSGMFDISKYSFFLKNDAPRLSHMCCFVMKKTPAKQYEKQTDRKPILATMTEGSALRRQKWLENGCNAYNVKRPKSTPMAFWTEQDVLAYIKQYNISICSVYGNIVIKSDTIPEGQMTLCDVGMIETETAELTTTGCKRTGCMFCGFGCHLQKPGEGNFERMKQTHPKQYEWIMKPKEEGGLDYKRVIDWINEHGKLNIRY